MCTNNIVLWVVLWCFYFFQWKKLLGNAKPNFLITPIIAIILSFMSAWHLLLTSKTLRKTKIFIQIDENSQKLANYSKISAILVSSKLFCFILHRRFYDFKSLKWVSIVNQIESHARFKRTRLFTNEFCDAFTQFKEVT